MATIAFREGVGRPGPIAQNANQLVPNIVDGMASTRPSATYMELARDGLSYQAGSVSISYRDFANIINGIAWWIEKNLGRSEQFGPIVYMGINDIRYNSFVLACVKTGHKALLMSTMNPTQASISLLQSMECTSAVTSGPGVPDQLLRITESYSMKTLHLPELDELLQIQSTHYPYSKTFESAKHEPYVSLHTSGSTGAPKPIILSHAWAASYALMQQLEPPEGFESNDKLWQSNRLYVMVPPFHAGSVMASLISSIFNQTTVILPPAKQPRSARHFLEALDYLTIDAAFLGPAIVDELGKDPSLIARLAGRVGTIFWAGGNISDEANAGLSTKVKLFNINGSTETGGYPLLRPSGQWDSDLAHYICLHKLTGASFEHVVDNSYRLKIVRNKDEEVTQPAFRLFRDVDVYDTKDLFSPHPTKANFWRWQGRADDIIALQQGLKVNPIAFEAKLMGHPAIKGALLLGTSRTSLVFLVEPTDTDADPQHVVDKIWPLVVSTSDELLGGLAVTKEKILVTAPGKPMSRAGKGTIQRQPTNDLYQEDLDKLYAQERLTDFEGIWREIRSPDSK